MSSPTVTRTSAAPPAPAQASALPAARPLADSIAPVAADLELARTSDPLPPAVDFRRRKNTGAMSALVGAVAVGAFGLAMFVSRGGVTHAAAAGGAIALSTVDSSLPPVVASQPAAVATVAVVAAEAPKKVQSHADAPKRAQAHPSAARAPAAVPTEAVTEPEPSVPQIGFETTVVGDFAEKI